jgi:thioesterase domain-containing protein
MVPSRLVILASLPITPSGKVDRLALAELDLAEPGESEPPVAAGDPLVRSLLHIWTRLLGRPVTDTSASFFDLGGDSLLVVQMFTEAETCLGRACDAPAFFRNPTISNLATLLRTATPVDWSAPVIALAHGEPHVRPLFLAPGVSGSGLDYVHLAAALSSEVPVYALQDRPLRASARRHETLREAVARYTTWIREVQPRGPYAIAGFSAGGIVAMAIAQELRELGESTDFVGLIDSVPPKSVPVPSPFGSPRRLVRLSRTAAGRVREVLSGPGGLSRLWARARSAALRGLTRWNVLPLGREPTMDELFADAKVKWSDEEKGRMRQSFEAIWHHEFRRMPIDMTLFRVALDPFEGPHEPELGWQRVTSGKITIQYLTGTHERLLTAECARELASRLEPYLKHRVAIGVDGPW